MEEKVYPQIIERVKAVLIDMVILLAFMFGMTKLFSQFENVNDQFRIVAAVFIAFIYDPLFTSLFGGTLGHFAVGIRVKRANNENKNILFPLALVRYLFKVYLGWISLITVYFNKRSKAIHDMVVGSVVIYKD